MSEDSPCDRNGVPPGPVQFSLRHLLAVVMFVSASLALIVQLRFIGFFAAVYLAGVAAGWLSAKWRWFLASLTALLVYSITFLASWVQLGYAPKMDRVALLDTHNLPRVEKAIQEYAEAHGEFPDLLQQLPNAKEQGFWVDESGQLSDWRGQPLYYRKTADGFELAALGRDGKPGGVGFDADVFPGDAADSPRLRLPLSQFLFEADAVGGVWLAALFASLQAWNIIVFGVRQTQPRPSKLSFAAVAVTTVFAVVIAMFLAAIYVAAGQSGH